MDEKQSDPLHGHCLCLHHVKAFSPRRTEIQFFFMPQESLSEVFLCGRCAPKQIVKGGLIVSQESLERGVVTFMKNAAIDLRKLKDLAIRLEDLKQK